MGIATYAGLIGALLPSTLAASAADNQSVPVAVASPSQAPTASAPASDSPGAISIYDYWRDQSDRMTVPVSIKGTGPYRFVVDTGAERTVISHELATQLQLGPGRSTIMSSMTEAREVPTVVIPALEINRKLNARGINAPAMLRANLGAEGMLGVDSLKDQRVTFDFRKQTMAVTPSSAFEPYDPDTIVVTARSRFGTLVLVDASVEREKVWVIVDTGSQVTIGNEALRAKLQRHRKIILLRPIQMMSVTGGLITADYTTVKSMKLGGVDFKDLPMAFSDVHPFHKLNLIDRPAILLGMDSLRLFQRVSVDFKTRKVKLLAPGSISLDPEISSVTR